jgi:hypothetical protein
MRPLRWALGGLLIGALTGVAWFFIILLMPSDIPDDVDGGAGLSIILLVIAAVFAALGGVVGCLVGVVVGGLYHLATGTVSSVNTPGERVLKPGNDHPLFDDVLG